MTDNYKIENQTTGQYFECSEGEPLLKAMLRGGQKHIPVGCLGGGCGLCKVRIVEGQYRTGKMSRRHITENDKRQRYVLACKTYPASDMQYILEI